ncbi:MAG TPA: 2Fe-2S iron-sulfur cluster-binding protein [Vicinamibacterales bacterium]|jgi:NADH-quinone oxidoreductase subunit G|nr:2Fe-2S iron-sulfur cluster-binding protein [Vicinamibacterales bacterium]
METVTLTIDGRQVTVEKGKTVLQAAIESGITVPYYCYHPGIGIDGSCRVCIVKIEKMPKLQTSCSTVCTDGMVVSTRTPEVEEARAGVFEFLLVNHPLDCPVCDKGGECPLQDFSYSFGPDQSRMEFPRRVFDGEGVKGDVDFGPTLMLNRQRCILCTRCVRFMRDVEGDAQINIIDRGYGSEIATFEETGVHTLMSGNLMDVCPVGAITTRDYRFKARPWDNPNVADTICTRCAKGCNVTAWIKAKPEWAKGSRLIRFTPRLNPDVNGYWMCDIGRFDYHWIESDARLRRPLVIENGTQTASTWHEALPKAVDRLAAAGQANPASVRFLVSAHASNEELFLVRQLARELIGESPTGDPAVSVSWTATRKDQPPRATFKIPEIDAPNVAGAKHLGLVGREATAPEVAALRRAIEDGRVNVLYVIDPGPDGSIGDVSWIVEARRRGRIPLLIVQGVLLSELARIADFVLPGASSVEKEASYINEQSRLQATARALPLAGEAVDDWQTLVNVGKALGVTMNYTSPADVRRAIARAFSGDPTLSPISELTFAQPTSAQSWLQGSNPSERWKWDFMYQDLPPVKGAVDPSSLPPPPAGVIPLKKVP